MIKLIFILKVIFCQSKFKFRSVYKNIPSPMKKETGGEDAWYNSDFVLAVADGVGGWNRHGVDPAKFSRKLMANIEEFYP